MRARALVHPTSLNHTDATCASTCIYQIYLNSFGVSPYTLASKEFAYVRTYIKPVRRAVIPSTVLGTTNLTKKRFYKGPN